MHSRAELIRQALREKGLGAPTHTISVHLGFKVSSQEVGNQRIKLSREMEIPRGVSGAVAALLAKYPKSVLRVVVDRVDEQGRTG